MAVDTKEIVIDDRSFSITQFLADEGLDIQTILLDKVSDCIPPLTSGTTSLAELADLDRDVDRSLIGKAVQALLKNLNKDTVALVKRMLFKSSARIDGREINDAVFNTEFAGKYLMLYKLIWQIIRFNYGDDFFGEGGIGDLIQTVRESKGMPSQKDT